MQHVGANRFAAEAGVGGAAPLLRQHRLPLLFRLLDEPRLEDAHRGLLVRRLGALVLALHDDPVGRCVMRTALSVLFTCWPPAPCARYVSIFRSPSSISTSASSGSSGATITVENAVWRRCAWSNGLRRTRRCLPRSALRIPYAFSPPTVNVADFRPASSPGLASSSSTLKPAVRRPPLVHAQHHLGPVLRVGAARARLQRDDRVAGVVLAVEERRLLQLRRARARSGPSATAISPSSSPPSMRGELAGVVVVRLQRR